MEERELTEEEIVKALTCCGDDHLSCSSENCPLREHTTCQPQLAREALDFIQRLQGENERLSLIAGIVNKGVAVEIVNMQETIDKQKAEIERLTEEIDQRRNMMQRMDCNYATELQKNAELQKQVDELKIRNEKLLCDNCAYKDHIAKIDTLMKEVNERLDKVEEQAIKDTAKEIAKYLLINDEFGDCSYAVELIKERYGVEVE